MAYSKSLQLLVLALVLSLHNFVDASAYYGLADKYYINSCPNAESLIQAAVNAELDKNLKLAAGIIRMQFHDSFVEGCDASVLLDGTDTEKTSPVNEHLSGFEVIDAAKAAVEAACPGVVSCADIIAYAARDSTVKLNGTGWEVQGGRKDGTVSCRQSAEAELPPPTFAVSQLIDSFARRGLSMRQMVILSGSHTVGVGHCDTLIERLYHFSAKNPTDPSLNAKYAEALKQMCPQNSFNASLEIFMDTITPGQFDSNYYVTLTQRKGLFTSDQSLFEDLRTKRIVGSLRQERVLDFQFGQAMRALAAVGVKPHGEIRTNCRQTNMYSHELSKP